MFQKETKIVYDIGGGQVYQEVGCVCFGSSQCRDRSGPYMLSWLSAGYHITLVAGPDVTSMLRTVKTQTKILYECFP